jgi:hypothetical protein
VRGDICDHQIRDYRNIDDFAACPRAIDEEKTEGQFSMRRITVAVVKRANEISTFFNDDWKVSKNVTLNLGIHRDWFGVLYEAHGLAGRGVGGYQGICPYSKCGLVSVEFVGKNSSQPGKQFFMTTGTILRHPFGFSWSVPGLGKTTILRAGYGVSYSGRQIAKAMATGGLDSLGARVNF